MRDIFIVLFFLVTVYYCFKKPYIGVAAWIWIAFMIPTSWAFGFSQHLRLNLSIVLLLVVSYVLYRDKPKYNFTNIHFEVRIMYLVKNSYERSPIITLQVILLALA